MALVATYDAVLSRIKLAVTGASGTATYMLVDRSLDGFITSEIVRGGNNMPIAGGVGNLDDYEFPAGVAITYRARTYNVANVLQNTFTVGITQDLTAVWLKVPAAPFLNRVVTVSKAGDKTRPARRAIHGVIGRNAPVAVSDVRLYPAFDLDLYTFTKDEEETLDLILGSGEILFFHLPSTNTCMDGGYYSVGDVTWGPPGSRARAKRKFVLPLQQVAPPGPDVIGSSYSWLSVVADYATWNAVVAANASWFALMQHVGSPSVIVVP